MDVMVASPLTPQAETTAKRRQDPEWMQILKQVTETKSRRNTGQRREGGREKGGPQWDTINTQTLTHQRDVRKQKVLFNARLPTRILRMQHL